MSRTLPTSGGVQGFGVFYKVKCPCACAYRPRANRTARWVGQNHIQGRGHLILRCVSHVLQPRNRVDAIDDGARKRRLCTPRKKQDLSASPASSSPVRYRHPSRPTMAKTTATLPFPTPNTTPTPIHHPYKLQAQVRPEKRHPLSFVPRNPQLDRDGALPEFRSSASVIATSEL